MTIETFDIATLENELALSKARHLALTEKLAKIREAKTTPPIETKKVEPTIPFSIVRTPATEKKQKPLEKLVVEKFAPAPVFEKGVETEETETLTEQAEEIKADIVEAHKEGETAGKEKIEPVKVVAEEAETIKTDADATKELEKFFDATDGEKPVISVVSNMTASDFLNISPADVPRSDFKKILNSVSLLAQNHPNVAKNVPLEVYVSNIISLTYRAGTSNASEKTNTGLEELAENLESADTPEKVAEVIHQIEEKKSEFIIEINEITETIVDEVKITIVEKGAELDKENDAEIVEQLPVVQAEIIAKETEVQNIEDYLAEATANMPGMSELTEKIVAEAVEQYKEKLSLEIIDEARKNIPEFLPATENIVRNAVNEHKNKEVQEKYTDALADGRIKRYVSDIQVLSEAILGKTKEKAGKIAGLFNRGIGETGRQLGKIWPWMRNHVKTSVAGFAALAGTAGMLATHTTPQDLWLMASNWTERHWIKSGEDDPELKQMEDDADYTKVLNDPTAVQKTTYDYLGKEQINYKTGYYSTLVMDLTDRTPPHFEIVNNRNDFKEIDSTLGLTTNLFKPFYKPSEIKLVLGEHAKFPHDKISVIAYNTETKTIKAGPLSEFEKGGPWLVSETYSIPLNFKLNPNGKINVHYDKEACRQCPVSINEDGKEVTFQIGVSADKNITEIDPTKVNNFGVLEGGKCIMVCGEKQIQVNGGFADIYKVYQKIKAEFPNQPITAYLLDNGSYNLPIMKKDHKITREDLVQHFNRNRGGGTALALMNDMSVSPFEYNNKYKEVHETTEHIVRDSVTHEKMVNEKKAIILHHTGDYDNNGGTTSIEKIINHFKAEGEGASAHVLIAKDGTRYIFNTENDVMWHAGWSILNGREKVNDFSIGIEIEGDTKNGHHFTQAQMESLIEYSRPLIQKYNIPFDMISDHATIRDNYIKAHPEKKVDTKRDLDGKIFNELQNLLKRKIYVPDSIKNSKLTSTQTKVAGATVFMQTFKKQPDVVRALETTKQIMGEQGFTQEQIAGVEYIFTGNEIVAGKKKSELVA